VTEIGGAMDNERAGVAETYRRVHALPAETLALWRDLLRELVPTRGLMRVADVGCERASLPTGEPLHEWVDVFVFRR